MFRAAGVVSVEDLATYRQFGSMLEGHPTPRIPWVDVATGSLGQGLPYGVGMAIAGKKLDRLPFRVWVLCGDSEIAEGSQWEAFEHAAFYGLDNLTAILDINRLGQRGETMHGWDLDSYARRAEAFGWHAIEIDGHDVEAIDRAYAEASETTGVPTVIVARTIKGKGVRAVEDKNGFHGKALDDPDAAIAELGGDRNITVDVAKPDTGAAPHTFETSPLELPRYEVGDEVATRKAYGDALAAVGAANGQVVALDGEVSNSTYADIFGKAHPERFFEMYIAEQQLVAAAVGMQVLGWRPFASTFAAFWSRAYDFIRMSAISRASYCLSGSHAGRRRWASRTSPPSEPSTARPSCTRATRTRPRSSSRRWRASKESRTCGRSGPRRACSTTPTRTSRSAAAAPSATATTSRSWPPGSPCTRRSRRPTPSPTKESRRA
jgi:transketolase